MDQERPKTYIRASRTYAEQEADREKWNHRNSKSYKQRQEVNDFRKQQRISQEHFNQLVLDEVDEHDINKYGCPPPPEPKITDSPEDAEEEDDPIEKTKGKKDNEEDKDQNSIRDSFESARSTEDDKNDKDVLKKNKSQKDYNVTKIASELQPK